LVLGAGGSRLAKRDGAVTLDDRLHRGDSIADLVTLLAASAGISTMREAGAVPTMAELATRFEPAALRRTPWQLSDADLGAT
jgi:glutamyl-tRNA synthetase